MIFRNENILFLIKYIIFFLKFNVLNFNNIIQEEITNIFLETAVAKPIKGDIPAILII